MSDPIPELYFRLRENGAQVFRVETENRHRRLEMTPLAVINVRNGDIKPQGERAPTDAERAVIGEWLAARRRVLAERDHEAVAETVERLNLVAHWAQSKASDAELEAVTDHLLMAMYDLRTVLVRKKADRIE